MSRLCDTAWKLVEADGLMSECIPALKQKLGENYGDLCCAILRHVFLIELVKIPKIESTKFRVRWCEQLQGDQRKCPFSECVEIAAQLLADLDSWLNTPANMELLRLFFRNRLFAYEMPLDYRDVPGRGDDATRIHRFGNLEWVYDETMARTLKLRQFLRDPQTSPDAEFFRRALESKIQVKTYLTDRALTGPYKTNREKRWEAHPHSVQFATRRSAMKIEYVLITQLCAFEGFPASSKNVLLQQGILPEEIKTIRCPVTQEPMSFPLFRDALINPQHGKSEFQIGHLNPLKLDQAGNGTAGHTADNISWISEDGNRIQGSLSLESVRGLLQKIATNYEQLGLVKSMHK